MSAPKVVRTTYYQDMDRDGFPVGTPVVILPAACFDRMVERERIALGFLNTVADGGTVKLADLWDFLDTRCTCPSDEDVAGVLGGDIDPDDYPDAPTIPTEKPKKCPYIEFGGTCGGECGSPAHAPEPRSK